MDTAGIRKTKQLVEKEGIKKSKMAIEMADVIVLVLDASRPLSSDDLELINICPQEKTICIWNKVIVNDNTFKLQIVCMRVHTTQAI
jgi:tRNA modification GTPase